MTALRDDGALRALEPSWRALAVRRGNAFITPEWFHCWRAHYGRGVTPLVPVTWGDDGEVKGLLPLALAHRGRPRTVRIAGSALGDRFHPVSEPGEEEAIATAAGEALAVAADEWSVLALDRADLARPWVRALRDAVGFRTHAFERVEARLPQIELSRYDDWVAYLNTRSKNLRQQLRRFTRRANSKHGMRLRRCERPDQLRGDMATFFELHDRRWAGLSSLRSPRARSFLADFAEAALARGWLRLWVLELGGEPAASWFGWRLGDRYSYYNGGLDPDWAHASPGLILMGSVIESAFEEGASRFDLLLGEHRHKLRFADGSDAVGEILLVRAFPHPAAAVASAERSLRGLGRRLPDPLQRRLRSARASLLWGRDR